MSELLTVITGHKKFQFKSIAEANKAYNKVRKAIRKTDEQGGVLVLRGSILIIPASIDFIPEKGIQL